MPYIGTRPHWYLRDRARGLYGPHALEQGGGGFDPFAQPWMYDGWDAERPQDIDMSGAAVTAWRSAKNGYSAEQASSNARPSYSPTGFNARPVITFDGVDDTLTFAGVGIFPVNADPCEIWALVDQTDLASNVSTRVALAYGNAATVDRSCRRVVVSGVNRAQGRTGTGAATVTGSPAVDLSGRHVMRFMVGATASQIDADGVAGSPTAAVPTTINTRVRLGASPATTTANFWQGGLALLAVTAPLSTDEAAQMLAYLKARGGIT